MGLYVEAIGREEASIVVEIALVGTGWDVAAKDVAAVMEVGGNDCGSRNGRDRLSVNTALLVVGGRAAPKVLITNAILEAVDETVACGSGSCCWEKNRNWLNCDGGTGRNLLGVCRGWLNS